MWKVKLFEFARGGNSLLLCFMIKNVFFFWMFPNSLNNLCTTHLCCKKYLCLALTSSINETVIEFSFSSSRFSQHGSQYMSSQPFLMYNARKKGNLATPIGFMKIYIPDWLNMESNQSWHFSFSSWRLMWIIMKPSLTTGIKINRCEASVTIVQRERLAVKVHTHTSNRIPCPLFRASLFSYISWYSQNPFCFLTQDFDHTKLAFVEELSVHNAIISSAILYPTIKLFCCHQLGFAPFGKNVLLLFFFFQLFHLLSDVFALGLRNVYNTLQYHMSP